MKVDNNLEKRYITEIRANAEDRLISGTAIVFNSESKLINGSFRELIKPDAITPELINECNIVMVWNHEEDSIPLARSNRGKGTLGIKINTEGVDFEFKAKKTPLGDEVLEAVRAGDVDACSFAFRVADGGDSWERKSDGTYLRVIHKIELIADLSLVNNPAYLDTSCRSFDEFKATEVDELESYYEDLYSVLKAFNN